MSKPSKNKPSAKKTSKVIALAKKKASDKTAPAKKAPAKKASAKISPVKKTSSKATPAKTRSSVSEKIQPAALQDPQPDGNQLLLNNLVKKLTLFSKDKGFVTLDELNAVLPKELVTSDHIETLIGMLTEADISVTEKDEVLEHEKDDILDCEKENAL